MKDMWLFNYCRWNNTTSIIERLQEKRDIDLAYNEGIYFKLAIGNQNLIILDELLKYYRETKLTGDSNSMEYKNALFALKVIIDETETEQDGRVYSKEIKQIIDKHFGFGVEDKGDDEEEQDLSGLDLEDDISEKEDIGYNLHKSGRAPELLTRRNIIKNLLHSNSESVFKGGEHISYDEEMQSYKNPLIGEVEESANSD